MYSVIYRSTVKSCSSAEMPILRTSIRFRTVLMVNAVVAGMIVLFAYITGIVAGRILEEQLVRRTAVDTCRFLSSQNLAINDTMLRYLDQLFMVHFVAVDLEAGEVVASSLPAEMAGEFQTHLGELGDLTTVSLGDSRFVLGSAELKRPDGAGDLLLFAVSDASRLDAARTRVMRRIMLATLPAILLATLFSLLLAQALTRPIARLATAMDRIATETGPSAPEPVAPSQAGAPREIVHLADSFDRLMTRLDEAKRLLARSERLATLGKTAAGVAHELRNPLSAVKMHVRILRDEIAAEGADDPAFEVILKEIDRMELYLSELMSVASEGGGAGTGGAGGRGAASDDRLEPVCLSEAVESVLVLLSGRLSHAGIRVQREFADSDARVLADRGKIRQVLINLVINAIEAMPQGGELNIGVTRRDTDEGVSVRCSVADEGRGVQVEKDADIFDPFVSTKPDGAGLGLYLSKRIVESLGGAMTYENRANENGLQGAVFHFDLPVDDRTKETHA